MRNHKYLVYTILIFVQAKHLKTREHRRKGKINLRSRGKLIKISFHLSVDPKVIEKYDTHACMYESIQPFFRPTICRSVGTTLVAVVSYVVYA